MVVVIPDSSSVFSADPGSAAVAVRSSGLGMSPGVVDASSMVFLLILLLGAGDLSSGSGAGAGSDAGAGAAMGSAVSTFLSTAGREGVFASS